MKVSLRLAKKIAKKLNIKFDKFNLKQFCIGINTELGEHGSKNQKTNVTNDNPILGAKIALAHLNEFPDYYTRLAKMEKEAKQSSLLEIIQHIEKGIQGHCFKNVVDYVLKHSLPNVKIIHGEVNDKNGKRISHAWIINNDKVIDPTIGVIIPKIDYYKKLKAKEKNSYTDMQAIRMAMMTKNYGEWNKEEIKKFLK